MKPFTSLLRLTFVNYYGLSYMKQTYLTDKKKLMKPLLLGLVITFCFIPLLIFDGTVSLELYQGGKMLGEPALGIEISLLAAAGFILFFGARSVISALYFSDDAAFLASLPLRPLQVLGAKFIYIITNQYLLSAFFLLPSLFIYASGEGAGPAFLATAIILFLIYPIFTLTPAALIVVALMSRANTKRIKDMMTVVVYLFILTLAVVIQFFSQSLVKVRGNQVLQLLQSHRDLLSTIGHSFPPAVWATHALSQAGSGQGLLYLLLVIGAGLLLFLLLLVFGERIYYQGVLEGANSGRWKSHKTAVAAWNPGSRFRALLLREHRLFIRTPIYLLNVIPTALLLPFFIVLPIYTNRGQIPLAVIPGYLAAHPYLFLTIAGAVTFLAGMLPLGATSLTREGKLFFISQLLPVPPGEQIRAKIWYSGMVNTICVLPLFIVGVTLVRTELVNLMLITAISLAGIGAITSLGVLIDLNHPFLDWDNPQRAIKNNMNVLLVWLLVTILLLLLAGTAYLCSLVLPWPAGALLLLALLAGTGLILYRAAISQAAGKFGEIEL